jgi:hypothetical protein
MRLSGGLLGIACALGGWPALGADPAPDEMAAGRCPVGPEAACSACKNASIDGRCKPRYSWSWRAAPAANDASTRISGLRAVKGIDALARERGVTVVAHQRESNWPALLRSGRGKVHTSSPAQRERLCRLWGDEQWYHSWAINLQCPGAAARQYEQDRLCRTTTAVVRIDCASQQSDSNQIAIR